MPRMKLTDLAVSKITKAKPGSRDEYWDTYLPAFGLRVTDHGRKTWQIMYRVNGRQRRLTIGTYPATSLKDARKLAG